VSGRAELFRRLRKPKMEALEEMRGSPYNQGNPQFILWTPGPRGLRQEIIRGDLVCLIACLARRGSIDLAYVCSSEYTTTSVLYQCYRPPLRKNLEPALLHSEI
jgi:hypothetical protein